MKLNESNNTKQFKPHLRPSQSLHSHSFNKYNKQLITKPLKFIEEVTICILYKKHKIQFTTKLNTPF